MNANGARNLQIITVSSDESDAFFNQTIDGTPWVAVPFGDVEGGDDFKERIPCDGLPTAGILNGCNGEVVEYDVYGAVDQEHFE